MFSYQKTLQYPVRIKNTNPKLAAQIITQYGGPDGELGASLRYLSQRYAMPYPEIQGLLTDIGCEELRHTSYIRKKPLFSRNTRKDPAYLQWDKPGFCLESQEVYKNQCNKANHRNHPQEMLFLLVLPEQLRHKGRQETNATKNS